MTVSPPSPPILGMYQTNGAFPTGGPSAWPSGPSTNLGAEYFAWYTGWQSDAATFIAKCQSNGLTAFIELEPWYLDSGGNKHAILFSDITGGAYDAALTALGTFIASTGRAVILTFGHEMNVSGQYPWSQNASATIGFGSGPGGGDLTPSEWIAGWNYVRAKVNSTANGYALWMWACSAYTGGTTISPAPWWPGSTNVDIAGIDGYPNTRYGQSLGTFSGQIQPTVTIIRNLGWTQPIFLSETNLASMVASGGESITSFVSDMHAAGISGILEFEDAAWNLPQMTSAQWTQYNSAVASLYGTSGGGGGGGGGTGGGGTGGGTSSLVITKGTADEVSATAGVAHSVTPVSPPAGSLVRWEAAWLNSNDTLGLTFTAQDSAGNSFGAPTRKGTPGDGDGGCYLLVWDHAYPTAPGPVTLTVTASGSGVSAAAPSDCLILPYVITGQAANQSGAAFNNFSEAGTSTTTYEISLTTTVPGSEVMVLGAPNHNGGATGPVSPISSTVTDVDWDDATVGSRGTFGRSASPTAVPGPTTFGWTSLNPSPNGYGVMALEVLPSSSATTGFTAVGSPFSSAVTGSFPLTTVTTDDSGFVLCEVISETAADYAIALSSSHVTWEVLVAPQAIGTKASTVFIGHVTAADTANVTVTLNAGSPVLRTQGREFSASGGYSAVALDVSGIVNAGTAFPPLTPGHGAGELYWGFVFDSGTGAVGTTSGFTYAVDGNGNIAAHNTSCGTGTQQPSIGDSGDTVTGVAVLLYQTSAGTPVAAGAVPLSAGTALTVVPAVTEGPHKFASAAFTAAVAMTASGLSLKPGALWTAAPSLRAAPRVIVTESAHLSASPSLSANGFVPMLLARPVLSAAAKVTHPGAAALRATPALSAATSASAAHLAAAPVLLAPGRAAAARLFAGASLSASGRYFMPGQAALYAGPVLHATGKNTSTAAAHLAASTSLAATALNTIRPRVALPANAVLTARTSSSAAHLSATPALAGAAKVTVQAAAALHAPGTALTAARVLEQASAALHASPALSLQAVLARAGKAALRGSPALSAAGAVHAEETGAAAFRAAAVLRAAGIRGTFGAATLSSAAALSARGLRSAVGRAALSAQAQALVTGKTLPGVRLHASPSLTGVPQVARAARALLSGGAALSGTAHGTTFPKAAFKAPGVLVPTPNGVVRGASAFASSPSLAAAAATAPKLPFPVRPARNQPTWQRTIQKFAVHQERQRHAQALWTYGELAVFALMWRPEDIALGLAQRCTRCYFPSQVITDLPPETPPPPGWPTAATEAQISAAYGQGSQFRCTLCYGTQLIAAGAAQVPGVRALLVRPAILTDTDQKQQRSAKGVLSTGSVSVQTTPDFRVNTLDYCFRSDGRRYQLQVPSRTTLRTGFGSPWQEAAAVSYNLASATLEDRKGSVAYVMPPSAADLAQVLGTYTRIPADYAWFEQVNGPLIPGEEPPPAASGSQQPPASLGV